MVRNEAPFPAMFFAVAEAWQSLHLAWRGVTLTDVRMGPYCMPCRCWSLYHGGMTIKWTVRAEFFSRLGHIPDEPVACIIASMWEPSFQSLSPKLWGSQEVKSSLRKEWSPKQMPCIPRWMWITTGPLRSCVSIRTMKQRSQIKWIKKVGTCYWMWS